MQVAHRRKLNMLSNLISHRCGSVAISASLVGFGWLGSCTHSVDYHIVRQTASAASIALVVVVFGGDWMAERMWGRRCIWLWS